MFTYI